ncbi:MAG: GNAT family N-acetyltransferase [Methanomicrobiales archaeon]
MRKMYKIIKIKNDENNLKKLAEDLLYNVLWAPYNISREKTREIFEITRPDNHFFIAIKEADLDILGCIVINLESFNLEIKHLAVKTQFQGINVGKSLVNRVLNEIPDKIAHVIARNTSSIFWEKLGFRSCGEWIKHPLFIEHGIIFKKYCYYPHI